MYQVQKSTFYETIQGTMNLFKEIVYKMNPREETSMNSRTFVC